jgi:hypothetical protein
MIIPLDVRGKVGTDLEYLRAVLAWLFGHLAHFAACGIVVEELERRHTEKCVRSRGIPQSRGWEATLTFLFRFEMCSFIVGKYKFIFPSGSRMVVR